MGSRETGCKAGGGFKERLSAVMAMEPGPSRARAGVVTYELVPGRASKGKLLEEILAFSEAAAASGRICALSITDNAGGHPALTPVSLGSEIQALGIDAVIHFSCKDKNRNLMESQLFELDRAGLHNLLVVTGDYPRYGYRGQAKPVFDLDSVHALTMIQEMRSGLKLPSKAPGGGVRLAPMDFHAGCVVSPFKRLMSEQVQQYVKLMRKAAAGAHFVVTQMGFDLRKYHEALMVADLLGIELPMLATVLMPDVRLARIINRGVIPGCTLPDGLLARMEGEAASGDRQALDARLDRAAKMVASLLGMGFAGVHLSGPGLKFDHIAEVLDRAGEYLDGWQDLVSEFLYPEEWDSFLLDEDPVTGLNLPEPSRGTSLGARCPSPGHLLGKIMHELMFEPGKGLYGIAARTAAAIDGTRFERWLTAFEYLVKEAVYDCKRCGDCFLGDRHFLCPQSQCAKSIVNGPCGGSSHGWCEVWPGRRRCLYVREFDRMAQKDLFSMERPTIVSPRDWSLDRSSSWMNYFLGRDHHAAGSEGGK